MLLLEMPQHLEEQPIALNVQCETQTLMQYIVQHGKLFRRW